MTLELEREAEELGVDVDLDMAHSNCEGLEHLEREEFAEADATNASVAGSYKRKTAKS